MHINKSSSSIVCSDSTARRRIAGQGMTEYIIIVALIAIAAIVGVGAFGDSVIASFAELSATLVGGGAQDAATLADPNIQKAAQKASEATTLQNYNQ